MKARGKGIAVLAPVSVSVLALAVPADAASGGGNVGSCAANFYNDHSVDNARTIIVSGSCDHGVRHQYVDGSGAHWTPWYGTVTPNQAELNSSEHRLVTTVWTLH